MFSDTSRNHCQQDVPRGLSSSTPEKIKETLKEHKRKRKKAHIYRGHHFRSSTEPRPTCFAMLFEDDIPEELCCFFLVSFGAASNGIISKELFFLFIYCVEATIL
ncbi:hypothetical protein CEXT_599211 [Caerostris extrusa]|uniref:Uncharacterized protein n=1 Tax=Caerostris extrusa TaxID=172846 RepID=A0AAV4S649_CAEEX|nr:hypothetical protein CEXT_599211 [Caerostris extrusa]